MPLNMRSHRLIAGTSTSSLPRRDATTALVSVQCDGIGLPADFDFTKSKGLGLQIVTALAKQLGADVVRNPRDDGNAFIVAVPCEPVAEAGSKGRQPT